MRNKNKALLMLSLIMSLLCTQSTVAYSDKSFWDGLGIAALAVGVGVGIAKLADWCFTETNAQLVARARREYNNALSYNHMQNYWEMTYGLRRTEQDLCDIAEVLWNSGVNQGAYISDVYGIKNRLTAVLNSLHNRINEQRGRSLNRDELYILGEMNACVRLIEQLLPQFARFADSLQSHRSFFELYDYGMRLYSYYDREIRIIKTNVYADVMAYDIRQAIIHRNNGQKYPFITFVNKIDADVCSLKSYLRSAKSSYSIVIHNGTLLYDLLNSLRHIAISDSHYSCEQYQREQERLERLRIEALQEQARIEQARLNAMREHNRILERSNRLKEHELYQHSHDRYGADVKVVVNL